MRYVYADVIMTTKHVRINAPAPSIAPKGHQFILSYILFYLFIYVVDFIDV